MNNLVDKKYEKLKKQTIETFNSKMKEVGSCLRYIEDDISSLDGQHYKLVVKDKFLRSEDIIPQLTKEGKDYIKNYIEGFGVKFMFSNTIINI